MVYMVSVNSYDAVGRKRPMPELIGITTSAETPQGAVDVTLGGEIFDVFDVDVDVLSLDKQCWYVAGTETRQ